MPAFDSRADFVATVRHHDDGWLDRDRSPLFDPASGRVLDFMEMPLDESLTIWTASIEACSALGPLSAYAVSRHFCALLERSLNHHRQDVQRTQQAGAFLAEQRNLQADRLAIWRQEGPVQRTEARAQRALALLQRFDWLSLWLCCAEREQPEQIESPDGTAVEFTPEESGRFTVSPWPWQVSRLDLEVTGRAVAVAHYRSVEELAAADQGPVHLTWSFRPQ